MNKLIFLANDLKKDAKSGTFDEVRWSAFIDGLDKRLREDALKIQQYRKSGTCRCGHAFSRHDPADLTCDADDACYCGR